MFKFAVASIGLICALSFPPCQAAESAGVEESIHINATAEAVLSALRKYRNSPVDHRRLVRSEGTTAIVDEQVPVAPVIGTVHNVWEENEHGNRRIDYHLVESDKFKSGSGAYIIDQAEGADSATLTITSTLDTGIHFPGSNFIERQTCRTDVRARLNYIKKLAESNELAAR